VWNFKCNSEEEGKNLGENSLISVQNKRLVGKMAPEERGCDEKKRKIKSRNVGFLAVN